MEQNAVQNGVLVSVEDIMIPFGALIIEKVD